MEMKFSKAKELLENAGFKVEDTLEVKSEHADNTIHSIWVVLEKYFSGKISRSFKYDEIEIMRQIMISVSEYAQRVCELNGTPCNLETLKQLIKSEYDANHIKR